jgi:hypothetical protein
MTRCCNGSQPPIFEVDWNGGGRRIVSGTLFLDALISPRGYNSIVVLIYHSRQHQFSGCCVAVHFAKIIRKNTASTIGNSRIILSLLLVLFHTSQQPAY